MPTKRAMALSSSLRPHFPATVRSRHFRLSFAGVHGRDRAFSFMTSTARCGALHGINSVLRHSRPSINSNESPEPARALLERLFARTQKLEQQMNGNSHLLHDGVQSDINLENLESDLLAAVEGLRKKEEDLQEAERLVILEHAELDRARKELEQRERKIALAHSKQEKLEEELRQANLKLVSHARHIEDLKMRLKEGDEEIARAKSVLSSKEVEINKMRDELTHKSAEAVSAEAQMSSKAQLLDEANEIVKRQDLELQQLQNALHVKQQELEESMARQQLEEEKVKEVENKLEKQTMEWLLVQEELKRLGEEASRHIGQSKETMEDFQRVKRLLADVRSELVSSQKSLLSSRQKMEEREVLLEKQLLELEEQRMTVMSYMNSLKNAHVELESEKEKLRIAEAQKKELELDLSLKREMIEALQKELCKEKSSLQQAIEELSSLDEELMKRNNKFQETSDLLKVKEEELVDAKLEIQHLKSQQDSLQLLLNERDSELVTAKKRLEELDSEIEELRMLLKSREDQLIQATGMLKEKEDYVQAMQCKLNDTKLKASAAESVVERIVDLTNELVISTKEGSLYTPSLMGDMGSLQLKLLEKPTEDLRWEKKQLETELELTKESLRAKELELLATQRELTIKDEGLKMVFQGLEEKDSELKELKEKMLRDANDLKQLLPMPQDGTQERVIEDSAIEKLQLEAAQLEVEAATSALHKLVEMSRQLVNKAGLIVEADLDISVFQPNGFGTSTHDVRGNIRQQKGIDLESNVVDDNGFLTEVKSEVTRLADLIGRLVQEAGAFNYVTQ